MTPPISRPPCRAPGADLGELARGIADWQVWSLHDRPALGRFHKGRIALIGDAAHPILPFLAQGGALAIEDAAVLAAAIAEKPANIPAALAAYSAARVARAARVQRESRANGRRYHWGWPLAGLRDAWLARLGPERMRARYDWLYDWTASARR